jgi:hypothetical protein
MASERRRTDFHESLANMLDAKLTPVHQRLEALELSLKCPPDITQGLERVVRDVGEMLYVGTAMGLAVMCGLLAGSGLLHLKSCMEGALLGAGPV